MCAISAKVFTTRPVVSITLHWLIGVWLTTTFRFCPWRSDTSGDAWHGSCPGEDWPTTRRSSTKRCQCCRSGHKTFRWEKRFTPHWGLFFACSDIGFHIHLLTVTSYTTIQFNMIKFLPLFPGVRILRVQASGTETGWSSFRGLNFWISIWPLTVWIYFDDD